MKVNLIILSLLCSTIACKQNEGAQSETLESAPSVDTIHTGKDEEYSSESEEEAVELSIHEKYLPIIDSIIITFRNLDETDGWQEIKNYQNIALVESTEGNELIVSKKPDFTRYQLNSFGEMGKTEEVFYLFKNEIILYSHSEIRYNAPIYTDSTDAKSDEIPFDETQSEMIIEDSYFEKGKIVYQACQDCGAPNAKEYVESVEKNVSEKLQLFKKLKK